MKAPIGINSEMSTFEFVFTVAEWFIDSWGVFRDVI